MRILAVELRRLELELMAPLVTATGTHRRRPVILVHLETESGGGDGECDAVAEPNYTTEYADAAEAVLAGQLIPLLLAGAGRAGEVGTAEEAFGRLAAVSGNPMAKAAVEMALLDAELRASGRSLAASLGVARSSIPAGATVGIGSVAGVIDAARAAVACGYRRLKLKIAPGHDVGPLAALRRELPDMILVADANGSYDLADPDDRAALRAIDELGLAAIEQPLAAGDFAGSARLAGERDPGRPRRVDRLAGRGGGGARGPGVRRRVGKTCPSRRDRRRGAGPRRLRRSRRAPLDRGDARGGSRPRRDDRRRHAPRLRPAR